MHLMATHLSRHGRLAESSFLFLVKLRTNLMAHDDNVDEFIIGFSVMMHHRMLLIVGEIFL